MFGEPLHAVGPISAAVHQDFDGVPKLGNGGAPGGLAGQHFQDGKLEGHFHVSGLAGTAVSARSVNCRSTVRLDLTLDSRANRGRCDLGDGELPITLP